METSFSDDTLPAIVIIAREKLKIKNNLTGNAQLENFNITFL